MGCTEEAMSTGCSSVEILQRGHKISAGVQERGDFTTWTDSRDVLTLPAARSRGTKQRPSSVESADSAVFVTAKGRGAENERGTAGGHSVKIV